MKRPVDKAISARSLRFRYRGARRPALAGVDLDLPRGSWGLLLGPTGAGKSTLVRCLNGAIPGFFGGDLEGDLEVWGEAPGRLTVPEMSRRVGIVFQDFETQIFSTSCLLEVAFAMENRGLDPGAILPRAEVLLGRVGLAGFAARDPATLSGGEKQRLVIAAVLAMEAPVLVLDEPASDLDPGGRQEVYELIASLAEETVLLIDHDLEGVPPAAAGWLLADGAVARRWSHGESSTPGLAIDLERAGVRPAPIPRLAAELARRHPVRLGEEAGTAEQLDSLLRRGGWSVHAATGAPPASAPGGPPLIRCEGLTLSYDGRRAVDAVDLVIREGEFVGIIGANGSGKTTLARLMSGLERPTGGRALLRDREVCGIPAPRRAREIGFIFQNPDHQIFSRTVREEIAFGPVNLGLEPGEIDRRVGEALDVAELAASADEDPFVMTKGERQRLALASILACEPRAVVMDEPTTGLDLAQQRNVMATLARLHGKGHTIVIITHALWLLEPPVQRVVIMAEGRVAADGRPRDILTDGAVMARAGLRMPDLARLASLQGAPLISLNEWAAALIPPPGG